MIGTSTATVMLMRNVTGTSTAIVVAVTASALVVVSTGIRYALTRRAVAVYAETAPRRIQIRVGRSEPRPIV